MTTVFYPQNAYFLDTHGGGNPDYPVGAENTPSSFDQWANWDLCNMASVIAIGILADDQAMFDNAVNYFYSGIGEGRIDHLVWKIYEDGLGQVQEVSDMNNRPLTTVRSGPGTFDLGHSLGWSIRSNGLQPRRRLIRLPEQSDIGRCRIRGQI